MLGQGTVASATEINAVDLLTEATFLFAVPRAPGPVAAADENPLTRTPRALADGNVFRSITLPSYRSLGVARALTFVYNSTAADARPIVGAEVTFPTSTGLPPLIESRLEVGGIEVAGPVFTSTGTALDPGDPGLGEGQTVRLAHSFDAGSFPTGSYPTRTTATADFGCSKISAVAAGRIVIDNRQASPFGNGWSLAGLQRITEQPDGRLVLEEGDGTVKVFEPGSSVDVEGEITQLPEPPLDVRIGALEDDEDLLLFNEQLGLELPEDTVFNAIAPGFYNNNSQLQNLTLPAGAIVNSHYVHFDPLGSPSQPVLRQGTAVFPDDLIGVITRSPQLNATDALLGSPTTIYPTNAFQRGLELGVTSASDQITIGRDLRTLVLDNRTINRIDSIRVLTVPRGPSLAISRFETSGEDWTVSGGTNVSGPDREAAGGNPGGRLAVTGDGRFFWSAPESFLQGLASAYNGRLAYDTRLLDDSFLETVSEDLILSGAGQTVTYSLPYRPVYDVWTRVNVLLLEGAGWVLQGTSQAPTQAELESILADATELLIRADYRNVPGTTAYLDNVALTAQPIIGSAFASPPGDFSLLAKNVDGSFTRTLKDGTRFEYDTEGKLAALVDRNGNTTGYTYAGDDTLQSISDPADPSRLVSLAYLNGQLASVTDVVGRITAFGVNDTGDLASVTLPDDSQLRYAYDQNGRLINEVSQRGFVTTRGYGFAGQFTAGGFPDGSSISASISKSLGLADLGIGIGSEANPAPYARANGTAELVDAKGNPYSMRFNEFGSVVEFNDPIGRTTTMLRNADNLVTESTVESDGELPGGTVPGQVVTEIDYDERGNITAQREAAGTALERGTLFEYEPLFNNTIRITDPAGFETTFEYDAKGNLTKTTDALTGEQISTFDPANGLALSRQDPNGNLTSFAYDAVGNLQTITDAELNVTGFQRDAAGRVTAQTDGVGTAEVRTTSFTYDAMNRVETVTDGGIKGTPYLIGLHPIKYGVPLIPDLWVAALMAMVRPCMSS